MIQDNFSFGAIKPSFVDLESFIRTPFNFCDLWCERCKYQSICRVRKKELESIDKIISQGKDPDSMEATIEILQDNFTETIEMIESDCERLGINLNEIDESEWIEEQKIDELIQEHPTVVMCRELASVIQKLHIALENNQITSKEARENLEIFGYFITNLPAKVFRVYNSQEDEEKRNEDYGWSDARVSAAIAKRGYTNLKKAIKFFINNSEYSIYKTKLTTVIDVINIIIMTLDKDFHLNGYKN